jgi:beta-lactamase regulating signal transducer with metallopeptidase domain
MIWTLAIVGALLLPALSAVLPDWTALEVRMAAVPSSVETATTPRPSSGLLPDAAPSTSVAAPIAMPLENRETGAPVSWSVVMIAVYAAGIALLLARVVGQRWSLRRLARNATPVRDPEWTSLMGECVRVMRVRRPVRLLRSLQRTMPMAFGIRNAAILIPAVADTWTDDRRRAVLLHELAHVVRHDCLTQTLSAIACALYWIHPGAWWAARRLCTERELACDDRVVSAGESARDYAGHLLELAYTLGAGTAPALAVTMARSTQLEGRLMAVMDAARNRTLPALRSRLAALALLAALLLPLAAATTAVVSSAGAGESARASQASGQSTGSAVGQSELDPGTWEVRPSQEPGRVQVHLREGKSSYGTTVDAALINALAPGQLGREGPVAFSIRRDAGTFTFEGVMRKGVGAGTFSFTPDPAFAVELVKRGFARPTGIQQRRLAGADIGYAYLDELNRQGYQKPDLAQLVRAAEHDVNLTYLRDMGHWDTGFGSSIR